MKNTVAILLLLLLCLNTCGLVAVYQIMRVQTRQHTNSILTTCAHEKLIIFQNIEHSKDVIWHDDRNEFSLNGKMYDVARTERRNGIKYYYCYDDRQETKIVHKINALVGASAEDSDTALLASILSWLAQVFVHTPQHEVRFVDLRDSVFIPPYFYLLRSSIAYIDVPIPPPWNKCV